MGGHSSPVQKSGEIVYIGPSSPDFWVVLNKKVLGDKPGRSLRAALPELGGISLGVVESVRNLPHGKLSSVILAGDIPLEDREEAVNRLKTAKSLTLFNQINAKTACPGFSAAIAAHNSLSIPIR